MSFLAFFGVLVLPPNVLVAAVVPLAMVLCLLAGLAGMILPVAAGWFAWPARELLTYMLDMAGLLSHVPHAFLQNVGVPFGMMVGAYGVVGWWMWLLRRRARHKYATITETSQPAKEGA